MRGARCRPAASNGCRPDAACGTAAGLDKAGRNARLSSSGSPCRRHSNWVRPSASTRGHEDVPQDVPARVLLGRYGSAANAIASPSPINYLAVRLKSRRALAYQPPSGHTVLWAAVASGVLVGARRPAARRTRGFRAVERSRRLQKRSPIPSSSSARPRRTSTTSSSATTRSTRRRTRCAMARRTFQRSGRGSFKKAVCRLTVRPGLGISPGRGIAAPDK